VAAFVDWLLGRSPQVTEAAQVTRAPATPTRQGYEYGVPREGLNEYNTGLGASTGSDRRSQMQELYEAYLACPWVWACVNAIARTITAGGLVTDWDGDDGEGDQDQPDKPPQVLALEQLLTFVNSREDIRQLLRSTIADLLVFGDSYIEVVWVGSVPVALYTQDSPSTTPDADEHGEITGYVQVTDLGQRAEFDPHEIIHISLDSPRSGIFGVSPTQAAILPITAWLNTAATLKETFRKGNPPSIWADFPAGTSNTDIARWRAQYAAQNLGPRNIGTPVTTKGGAHIEELQQGKVTDYLQVLDQKRDEIIAAFGVPPAEAGIIESGNLGGGTGESQRKSFLVNTCQPIAELVLEKINYAIVKAGFAIDGWHLKFGEIDMRDSAVIENIRDMRLRNGAWTLNKYRTEISEPPVDGGDDAVLVDRQNLVLWRDMGAASTSGIAAKLKGTALEPGDPAGENGPVTLEKPEPAPVPDVLAPFAGQGNPPDDEPPAEDDEDQEESVRDGWPRAYRARLREALRSLHDDDTDTAA
jgi:HK97 family phage portal protein